jgi:acetyltransferase-like isoleucine patch superfamily enzyme
MNKWKSHGTGLDFVSKLGWLGKNVVIEDGVRIFFPERVEIGDDVYIGHDTILKGYFDKRLIIGSGTWIGPQCFMYAAGGIAVGQNVGIGPGVIIISSAHRDLANDEPILHQPVEFGPVHLDDNCDIGARSIILKGVRIGRGVQIGAGAVVTQDIPDRAVAAGVPARILRFRELKNSYVESQ